MSLGRSLKTRGVKGTIQFGLLKILGISKYQDEIDTLHYFLNSCADITQLKPTNDENLRKLQIALLQLIRIFDKLCKRYNLTYYLGGGNLLGAIRHHGFIPWDDDFDVIMPREDYEKVLPLFTKVLEPFGIIARYGGYFDDEGIMARLALAYRTLETGVWMDILPIDYCCAQGKLSDVRTDLHNAIAEYRKFYLKAQKTETVEQIKKRKEEIFKKYESLNNGNNKVYFRSCEFTDIELYNDEENIFPLIETEYEGYMFPVPHNSDQCLKGFYGDYMSFPRTGVQAHCDPDGTKASMRAVKHNVNMDDVISYLKDVYEKI